MSKALKVSVEETDKQLVETLHQQSAMDGLLARVYKRLGGEDRFVDFCDMQEKWFYTHMLKRAPSMLPTAGVQGEISIHIHHELPETELDGITIDEQGHIVAD